MIEIHPILLPVKPFDATKGVNIYFTFTGSKQVKENELVIKEVSTKEIVYSYEFSTFEKNHPIPPNLLVNGKVYSAKLRVKFTDDTYSPYSNESTLKTFSTPVLDIATIDGQGYVYNSDITFQAVYSQSENENVKTYRFSLYDENEELIETYPNRTPYNQEIFTETIMGLEKGKGYFIECFVITDNNMTYSHRERFIAMYIVPSVNGVIFTRNDSDEGFVRITANLKSITGTPVKPIDKSNNDNNIEQKADNYEYIDDEWIIIPKDNPLIFRGLDMNRASDYIMKIWCRNIPIGTKFLELSPPEDTGIPVEFWMHENYVIAVKEYKGIKSRYCSNMVAIPKDTDFMLYVKNIEHRVDLSLIIL
ncbi:hypothetical protein RVS70_05710 [Virgibacillus sp. M23]|uniref:hypothetical protein n=1 Tax=Virgibacillus sp. M23 TaxID=3079030 RepID=UPI002A91FD08|nr:hypothetical protein [Virgibacillus sp. M23]MDY7043697.1 hypothetical protein [Virgibacillus sp. M23]